MTAHTPGPLVYWCSDDACMEDNCQDHNGPWRIGDHGGRGGVVAHVYTTREHAALFASAPDLLAACEAVVARWESGDLAEAARMCASAAAKARGERT